MQVLMRLRLKRFNENDELLAVASYLDTLVILVDGLTKNLVPGNSNGMDAFMAAVVEEEAKTRQFIVDNDTKLWKRVEEEEQRANAARRSMNNRRNSRESTRTDRKKSGRD